MVGYLKSNLDEAVFARLVDKKPKPKVVSLVELIEQAKKRAATGDL